MTLVAVTRAVFDDLPRILALQKEAYLSEAVLYNDYSLPPLRQSLDEIAAEFREKVFLKAELANIVIGSVRLALDGRICHVGRLIVAPPFQRRGVGSALLNAAEQIFPQAEVLELFTGARSEGNLRLYERHGYCRYREEVVSSAVTLVYMRKVRAVPPPQPSPHERGGS